MGKEIERKFLVSGDAWRKGEGILYRQGYLFKNADLTIRVRVADDHGYITIKRFASTITRLEYEYIIPLNDANELLDNVCTKPLIEKTRRCVHDCGLIWEVDEFHGENKGLILAEVELEDENQQIDLPKWVGKEVSGITKFYNACLVDNPFNNWPAKEQREVYFSHVT